MARYFTIVYVQNAPSKSLYEVARLTEWDDDFMSYPLGNAEVSYSIRGWYCSCTGDTHEAHGIRNPNCIHVAIYRTWRRQRRPGPYLADLRTLLEPLQMYFVDDNDYIWRDNKGNLTKLSLVTRVNQRPTDHFTPAFTA